MQNLGMWEILMLLFPVWGIGGYMLPTIVGMVRKTNKTSSILINVFLGWTIIGWFFSFYLVLKNK